MFNIPNLFTASNLLCGVFAVILSLCGRIDLAPFAIFLGAVFDFFDGFLARKLKKSGELGKQLDSLADMVTFGLAPGIFMMVVLVVSIDLIYNAGSAVLIHNFPEYVDYILTEWKNAVFYNVPNDFDTMIKFLPFIALFIPFMSLFRLAKFNIDTRQTESFIGLNTPANTIFFTTFPLVLATEYSSNFYKDNLIFYMFQPSFLVPLIGCMSLMLVSELPMFSLKFKHFKWKGNELRFLFLITCGLLISFLLVWSIALIVLLYIILSLIENKFLNKIQNEVQS
ncbi:MAG: CDP-alcohol phosphatidyltransferase family protein [Flavobacteriia bacterium]|nr:CDP-alcohol phosphatidyltransferase family protein [Flavobacteriia bacterium]